ncbi:MAG: ATP-binding protein [Methylobacter sp.]|nr:MAG: ATP-binding protein [Methylobacter sp.]
MAQTALPVDQRVIDIDSRRFASIEKALVELITNSDDSYVRLEKAGTPVSGNIRITYERHQVGALLMVADQAEGMPFWQVCSILTYGGAHSPLARGEGGGRGYFGRGLKQAIYGLGHGWIETVHAGRFSRIDLFRDENGGYLYEDWGGDRLAETGDYSRLGIAGGGTQVTIVIENPLVNISHYRSVVLAVANNIYLRDMLVRRNVGLLNVQQGKETEYNGPVRYEEPPAVLLLGPDESGLFVYQQEEYPFILTLKRAQDVELVLKGDERTNGLVILSGMVVLDCQLFEYENQVGTEYLFGTVRCEALIEKLGLGMAIISDEREGLNHKDPFVEAFSKAVSNMIAPYVLAEQEKLKHLEHATTSGRTSHMIGHLLQRMSRAAVQDLGIQLPPTVGLAAGEAEAPAALRFSTPFYYRKTKHPFRVALLLDPGQFSGAEALAFDYVLPDSMRIEPALATIPVHELGDTRRLEWTVVGDAAGGHAEINARAGAYWAWCEIVVADTAYKHSHSYSGHAAKKALPRDHGADMFVGYEFRNLNNELERAVYSPAERKILINTGAPTVQLYVDGRGHFRDAARLLLAELFMDVISDELARHLVGKSGHKGKVEAHRAAKQDIIRRYGSEIHLSFLNG